MSPRHAWVVAMASPRADAVERLSTWVRIGRRGGDVAAATVLEIGGRWHRESLDRDPRDGEHLRDAIQLYQSIMEAARHHASDRDPYPAEVDAARYHAEALCALRAIGGP